MQNDYLSPSFLGMMVEKRLQELKIRKGKLQRSISNYPEGKIHIKKCKNKMQYYVRYDATDKTGIYLSKKEEKKIKRYLQKRYDEKILKLVQREINNLEKYLSCEKSASQNIQNVYSDYPNELKKYVQPIDVAISDYVDEWIKKPYEKKPISEENAYYRSNKGDVVRSKSELLIANTLYKMEIPYKYECPIHLYNGQTIYPDFTVLDIFHRKEIYWEHRGMMDDRDYARHAVTRIKDYEKSHIFLGEKLIITEETATIPLATDEIEMIIRHYFMKQ